MLYGKATEVGLTDVDTASSLTLMSADIERIVTGMETGHEVRDILPVISRCEERTFSLHISYANFLAFPGLYHWRDWARAISTFLIIAKRDTPLSLPALFAGLRSSSNDDANSSF
jgi:hypothetical protein